MVQQDDCFVCRKHRGDIKVPGGAIYEDDLVFVSSVMPGSDGRAYLGYVLVEPKRHVPDLGNLTVEEGQAIGREIARFSRMIRELTNTVHVYAFVLGDKVSHVHVHVVGRYPNTPEEWWGIKVDEWPDAPRGTWGEVSALCDRMRAWLAENPID